MITMTYNHLTKTDLTVSEFLLTKPHEKFSIREISRQIKRDYKLTHNSVQRLTARKIIIKKKYGKTELCELNLTEAAPDLIWVEQWRTKHFLGKNLGIKILMQNIREKITTPYYTLIIFGSYAKGTAHQRSDVDLLIIVPTKEIISEVERTIHTIISINPLKVHLMNITAADFKEMVEAKEVLNVGKEVIKSHIIVYGTEAYYTMVGGSQ